MQVWMTLLLVVQLLAALTMIGLVLVQHGKGADMGASFGGGASGSLFGATGSANFLSRSTAVCASVFFVATLALAFMADVRPVASGGSSVLDQAAPASTEPAPAAIPGDVPAPAAPSVPAPAALPAQAPAAAVPAPADAAGAVPAPAGEIPKR
ncbi:MAG: preprotein translocase subunit SecG [Burkholderiaceae bacterium]|jgi:preprotein translocase subunit SecG|nr:preprotein translocase subunit SecG [Burkholderiaceae bacterium]